MLARMLSFVAALIAYSWTLPPVYGQSNNANPFEPTLRQMETPSKRDPGPQYVVVDLSEKKLLRYYPELTGIAPAASQADLPKLLQKVGANVAAFWNSVPSVCAEEEVSEEKLDRNGLLTGVPVFTSHYRYIIRAHQVGEGARLSEGRTDKSWKAVDANLPNGFTLAQGFVMAPFHFHSFHQAASSFRYLGRQSFEGRQMDVVAFAQQPDKAELIGAIRVEGVEYQVAYQGIAWIDAESSQIARMRIDLLKPRVEVGSETTELRFAQVQIPVVNRSLWLPRDAVITRSTKNGLLREKHQMADYRIFTQAKDAPAAATPAAKPN